MFKCRGIFPSLTAKVLHGKKPRVLKIFHRHEFREQHRRVQVVVLRDSYTARLRALVPPTYIYFGMNDVNVSYGGIERQFCAV